MGREVILSSCVLNQWAMDFDGNFHRILKSIQISKENGSKFRIGPELEITGYGCYDHFYESDTFTHSFEVLKELLAHDYCQDILIDVGMPILHKNTAYNCRVIFLNKKIILIRPKIHLANDGNYMESRWFSPWSKRFQTEDFILPRIITSVTGQISVPIGEAIISTVDTSIGFEICEELWTPNSPHVPMSLDGVEIIANGSASHFQLGKTSYLNTLIQAATAKNGGIYMYSNHYGCDGENIFYSGGACISLNGQMIQSSPTIFFEEVHVITASLDLEDVRTFRNRIRSRSMTASSQVAFPRFFIDFSLSSDYHSSVYSPVVLSSPTTQMGEQITKIAAIWLWDYLRKSQQSGFFVALSGGIDSTACCCIIFTLCNMLFEQISTGNEKIEKELRILTNSTSSHSFSSPRSICNLLLYTAYLPTSNSSEESKDRASLFSSEINSYHTEMSIDPVVAAMITSFQSTLSATSTPKYIVNGGSSCEDLALQNLQARTRMVASYFLSQLTPFARSKRGRLLVIGTSNNDETLTGYFTKYDSSSADINPIGGLSKKDVKSVVNFVFNDYNLQSCADVMKALPSAELRPSIPQIDEEEMGMSYDELFMLSKIRKETSSGPFKMFCKLIAIWKDRYSLHEIAYKVKHFFKMYSTNRHKCKTLTPSLFLEAYSAESSKFDIRQFLYNTEWKWQFRKIDEKADGKEVLFLK